MTERLLLAALKVTLAALFLLVMPMVFAWVLGEALWQRVINGDKHDRN